MQAGRQSRIIRARTRDAYVQRQLWAASTLEGRQVMAEFRPLHDRVLVQRVEAEEKTPSGIIIPDTAKEKPIEGEVLAVGPGAWDETGKIRPLEVKPGDRVLFGKWAGTEVIINGEDRLIMKESDILGVMVGDVRAKVRAA
jgi:chaperonin GroES